jgi:hypothetical protein
MSVDKIDESVLVRKRWLVTNRVIYIQENPGRAFW